MAVPQRDQRQAARKNNHVGWVPYGLGQTKPNHYLDMARVAVENFGQLGYAWRILNEGCCDGCSLGCTGMKDWTMKGPHLCMIRLNMMKMNTMGAMDYHTLEHPEQLRSKTAKEMRQMGRLPYPMIWRKGEPGYRRVSWEEAIEAAATPIRATADRDPDRLNIYMTNRGLPNETYFVFQKVARFLGTNNIDNAARLCHSPSTSGLKKTIGYGATTISYKDWLGTDVLVLIGTNVANSQPVSTKYLFEAKKQGTRIIVVNPYKEEGLTRYWVPSIAESALWGTKFMDDFFQVAPGGDAAFFSGALKHLIETDRVNHAFIDERTTGFDDVVAQLEATPWEELEQGSGLPAEQMRQFADILADAENSIFTWAMGITQHSWGTQNVMAISNLALALGRIGRPKNGLNPMRGHSGVQGGAEMGAIPSTYGTGRDVGNETAMAAMKELWGFDVPAKPGFKTMDFIDAAYDGNIDVLYSVGGNFLETLGQPSYSKDALDRIPVRIFQDIVLSPMMLLEPNDVNIILPGATRYETPGGVTETSTERRVIFSPEVKGRRIGEAKPEWQIPMWIAEKAFPERANLIHYENTTEVREDISKVCYLYEPIKDLHKQGDNFQWGGPMLCTERFNTPDGLGHFIPAQLPHTMVPEGQFYLATRRGSQFNSMVWNDKDELTGAARDAVFISKKDAGRLGLANGDPVLLRSPDGEFRGRIRVSEIMEGSLQVYWPESQPLIAKKTVDPSAGVPDYNAVCEMIPLKDAAAETTVEVASN